MEGHYNFHQPEGALYDDDEIKFTLQPYTLFPFSIQTATRNRENKFFKSPLLEFKK